MAAADAECSKAEVDYRVREIRAEVKALARERRAAFVAVVPMGATVLATKQCIEGSSVFNKANERGRQRVCFVYAVSSAWDRPKAKGRRSGAASVGMLPDDFDAFCETIDSLITPSNENYAAVLAGRPNRSGAGLSVEAGVINEERILKAVQEKARRNGDWRVKRFRLQFQAPDKAYRRGVSGVVTETLFFFYRGNWPNKLVPGPRQFFGGSTWDDAWNDIPPVVLDELLVPRAVSRFSSRVKPKNAESKNAEQQMQNNKLQNPKMQNHTKQIQEMQNQKCRTKKA